MSASLQLRLIAATATQPVTAGFLPGTDVAAWLEEMARHPHARFFVVPDSADRAEAGGLLILVNGTEAGGLKFGLRVIPCALEHGCVVVPVSTRLDPQLTVEEAKRLLSYSVYFFHPAIGLIAFDDTDAITPGMLIVPPLVRATSWMQAMPGHVAPPRLARVMLTLPEDLEDLFGAAPQDIGSLSPRDLQNKAPLLERLRDKLLGGATGLGMGMLAGLAGLAKMLGAGKRPPQQPPPLPGSGASGTDKGAASTRGIPLLDQLQQWTAKQFEKLQRQRESEIQRLLKLLENNPELGLRYALPLTSGGDAARGQAPPTGRLGERNPTYGARRGSGPADVWDFSAQSRWSLQQKYRDLANRELAEGHYDRAAYIFAELLGDWHNAAEALARGRRFQEAARVYVDKLNNQPLAAKCLEDGGLLADALLIYAELAKHEKCGDLLRHLGREREAVAAYHEALIGSTDRLHDARILFDKLEQHGLAIAVLASGYPHSPQAQACLERHFEYLTRLNATPEALALAAGLADPARQISQAVVMAETLHSIHRAQPDPEVQNRLSIVAMGVIGTSLMKTAEKDRRLLDLLPDFAASDLLLKRDAGRHLDERERSRRRQRSAVPTSTQTMLFMSRKHILRLPQDGTEWTRMISRGNTWLVAGQGKTRQDVWVMGEGERMIGRVTSGFQEDLHFFQPALPLLPDGAWLPFVDHGSARYFQARKENFLSVLPQQTSLSALSWLPPGVLTIHPVAEGAWVLHRNVTETIDLSFYTYQGQLLRIHAVGWTPPAFAGPILMVTHDEEVFISAGVHLLHVKHGHIVHQMEMPNRILHLAASRSTHPAAVLAVCGHEVVLLAPGKKSEFIQLFSSSSGSTCGACFFGDGRIAVGDDSNGLAYSAYPDAKLISSIALASDQKGPVGSYAAWGERGLAIMRRDGVIELYE